MDNKVYNFKTQTTCFFFAEFFKNRNDILDLCKLYTDFIVQLNVSQSVHIYEIVCIGTLLLCTKSFYTY